MLEYIHSKRNIQTPNTHVNANFRLKKRRKKLQIMVYFRFCEEKCIECVLKTEYRNKMKKRQRQSEKISRKLNVKWNFPWIKWKSVGLLDAKSWMIVISLPFIEFEWWNILSCIWFIEFYYYNPFWESIVGGVLLHRITNSLMRFVFFSPIFSFLLHFYRFSLTGIHS